MSQVRSYFLCRWLGGLRARQKLAGLESAQLACTGGICAAGVAAVPPSCHAFHPRCHVCIHSLADSGVPWFSTMDAACQYCEEHFLSAAVAHGLCPPPARRMTLAQVGRWERRWCSISCMRLVAAPRGAATYACKGLGSAQAR